SSTELPVLPSAGGPRVVSSSASWSATSRSAHHLGARPGLLPSGYPVVPAGRSEEIEDPREHRQHAEQHERPVAWAGPLHRARLAGSNVVQNSGLRAIAGRGVWEGTDSQWTGVPQPRIGGWECSTATSKPESIKHVACAAT